ncbi:MAG: dihydropteroate synthase [Alphaproteobacteria bacterium]
MVQPIDQLPSITLSPNNADELETEFLLHPRGLISWEVIFRNPTQMRNFLLSERELDWWGEKQPEFVREYIQKNKDIFAGRQFRFCGLTKDQPFLMGIVNVTPDSFSDGGEFLSPDDAITKGLSLMGEGADIIDVGGESTRPGAQEISAEEEKARVIPVVEGLAAAGATVSVDTRHSETMEAAIQAGAKIINDISALTDDEKALAVIKKYPHVSLILMHKQGQPNNMQNNFQYNHVITDVYDYLLKRVRACEKAGIERARISVDPGIGFGKSVQHNLDLMGRLSLLRGIGCIVTLGASRKSFIAAVSRDVPPNERVYGSLSAAMWSVRQGAGILRVHDVNETKQALDVWQAVQNAGY